MPVYCMWCSSKQPASHVLTGVFWHSMAQKWSLFYPKVRANQVRVICLHLCIKSRTFDWAKKICLRKPRVRVIRVCANEVWLYWLHHAENHGPWQTTTLPMILHCLQRMITCAKKWSQIYSAECKVWPTHQPRDETRSSATTETACSSYRSIVWCKKHFDMLNHLCLEDHVCDRQMGTDGQMDGQTD